MNYAEVLSCREDENGNTYSVYDYAKLVYKNAVSSLQRHKKGANFKI